MPIFEHIADDLPQLVWEEDIDRPEVLRANPAGYEVEVSPDPDNSGQWQLVMTWKGRQVIEQGFGTQRSAMGYATFMSQSALALQEWQTFGRAISRVPLGRAPSHDEVLVQIPRRLLDRFKQLEFV